MKKSTEKQKVMSMSLPALLAAAVVICLVLPFLPPSEERLGQSLAELEYARCYALKVDGRPVLYVNQLGLGTTETSVAASADSVTWQRQRVRGCWTYRYLLFPVCQGRLVAEHPDDGADSTLAVLNRNIDSVLIRNIIALEAECKRLQRISRQLDYYLDVHNVNDEGYNAIATLGTKMVVARQQRLHALEILKNIRPGQKAELELQQRYTLLYKDSTEQPRRINCAILGNAHGGNRHTLQTDGHFMPRQAKAVFRNMATASLIGQALQTTPRPWQATVYHGETASGQPHGHGIRIDRRDDSYYDGMWENGKRHGFGFGIDSVGRLRVGEWQDDRYKGERLTYTTDRIYGIDISRYQHDIGKKRYGIDWSKMRITHLGTISKKRVRGTVDYPVSFIYIKSTEGTTVRNPYYNADYNAARSHGLHVGSYHFFSTKSSAADQARYFLRMSKLKPGDFPPVLDVEPFPSQIRDMGGPEVLFSRVRTWLKAVEQATGVKPILYVGQSFVNNYLPQAPDIMQDYHVWIARYGEYKPEVQLAIWQLSPDGRVSGIHGDVDINVFNGYGDQWEDFLDSQRIRQ